MPSADSLQIQIEMGAIHAVSVAFADYINRLSARHEKLRCDIYYHIANSPTFGANGRHIAMGLLDEDKAREKADRPKKEAKE